MNLKEEEQPIYIRLFRRLFSSQRRYNVTPFHQVARGFIRNKIAVVGLILFVFLFVMVILVPWVYPLQKSYQEVTQQNVSPGRNLLSIPKELQNNVKQIAVGSTFSVGISEDGDVFLWGKYSKALKEIPKGIGNVNMVSAGLNHILALDDNGKLYAWGSNRFGQTDIPKEVSRLSGYEQIFAGNQYSIVVSKEGNIYFWGNPNLVHFDATLWQGQIQSVAANMSTVLAKLKNGNVVVLSKGASSFANIPKFSSKVIDLAMTATDAYAIDEDGRLYQWGSQETKIDKRLDKFKRIEAGRYHVVLLDTNDCIKAFGDNQLGQVEIPECLEGKVVLNIFAGYYQNYAVTKEGNIVCWGLKGYLLGTDGYGRDLFVRLMNGGRWTMTIGAIAVLLQSVIGIVIGGFAGYCGGQVDNLLMRLAEVVNSLPFLPFAMILSALIGNKLTQMQRIYMIMVVLGILNWPGMACLVRAQILSEKSKEFVIAAKAIGIHRYSIIFQHIMPNVMSYVIVSATGSFAASMLTESSLSFLGFGVVEPEATWGNMLTAAQSSIVISTYWWRWVFPALALAIATISINMVGDGLREAMDPKHNK